MTGTPSAPTGDGSTLSPEAKDRKSVKRTKEEVLSELASNGVDAFTIHHHGSGLSFLPVPGPFDDSEAAKVAINEWCHNKTLQPLGTFKIRANGTRMPTSKRGRKFKVECRKGCGYSWWYEKASDEKYYFQNALCLMHGPNCLNKDATAARRRLTRTTHMG